MALILAGIGVGVYYSTSQQKLLAEPNLPENVSQQITQQTVPQVVQPQTETPKTPVTDPANTKTFTVKASNFSFDVKEIKVSKGDTVKIVLINDEGFHDWMISEFAGAKTKQLNVGETETVTFVADKAGTFEYYCSVGKHREMGMVGKLIVE